MELQDMMKGSEWLDDLNLFRFEFYWSPKGTNVSKKEIACKIKMID